MNTKTDQRTYLLRLWRGADAQWRVSLLDPHTGERRAFATLERLVEHLAETTKSDVVPPPDAQNPNQAPPNATN